MNTNNLLVLASSESDLLEPALRKAGWQIAKVRDVPNLQKVIAQSAPAALVIDSNLPQGGAGAAVRWLRSYTGTAAVTVVALVSRAQERMDLLAAGVQDCIDRPANPASVVAALEKLRNAAAASPAASAAEAVRLAALRASGLLDTPPEEPFDRLTKIAAQILGVPVALLSLVDADRQFFKSQIGLSDPWAQQRQTPITHSFCRWVVSSRAKMVVADARLHPVLRDNPAIRDLGVIAYAGVPIADSEGQVLGSLCAIDARPHDWLPEQIETLTQLGRMVEAAIAHGKMQRNPPRRTEDLDAYANATGEAIAATTRIMRSNRATLTPATFELLLEVIDFSARHLVQINRMLQVTKALG